MSELVSVVVISYNSDKFILETLESIKIQTFQTIELIISDDFSTDNTIEIAKKWCEENKFRFSRVEIVVAAKNTGIAANCNQGVKAATGNWVKLIAADDILEKNCIQNNINFVNETPNAKVIYSKVFVFDNETRFGAEYFPEKFFKKTAKQQFFRLCNGRGYFIPSLFIFREFLLQNGGFDETFLIEDVPFLMRTVLSGEKLYGFDKLTVFYRICKQGSATQTINIKRYNDVKRVYNEIIFPQIENHFLLYLRWKIHFFLIDAKIKNDKRKKFSQFILKIFYKLIVLYYVILDSFSKDNLERWRY